MVKFIKQKTNTDCGTTCIKMITGEDVDIGDKKGTSPFQWASYLIKKGYDVKTTYFNPFICRKRDKIIQKKSLIKRLNNYHPYAKPSQLSKKHFLNYLKKNDCTIQMIDKEYLLSMIDEGFSVLCACTTNYRSNFHDFNFHVVLVNGREDEKLIVYDPSLSKPEKVNINEFLMSFYACLYVDLSAGAMVFVDKKSAGSKDL